GEVSRSDLLAGVDVTRCDLAGERRAVGDRPGGEVAVADLALPEQLARDDQGAGGALRDQAIRNQGSALRVATLDAVLVASGERDQNDRGERRCDDGDRDRP